MYVTQRRTWAFHGKEELSLPPVFVLYLHLYRLLNSYLFGGLSSVIIIIYFDVEDDVQIWPGGGGRMRCTWLLCDLVVTRGCYFPRSDHLLRSLEVDIRKGQFDELSCECVAMVANALRTACPAETLQCSCSPLKRVQPRGRHPPRDSALGLHGTTSAAPSDRCFPALRPGVPPAAGPACVPG